MTHTHHFNYSVIWNTKSQSQRSVTITPSTKTWSGTGLLGVTIRPDDYTNADTQILRILSIIPNSPASLAGFLPSTDYILGDSQGKALKNDETLKEMLECYENEVLELYVYNSENDTVRIVTIVPTLEWVDDEGRDGGSYYGLLGAEIGRGYLHGIPGKCRHTHGIGLMRSVDNFNRDDNDYDDYDHDDGHANEDLNERFSQLKVQHEKENDNTQNDTTKTNNISPKISPEITNNKQMSMSSLTSPEPIPNGTLVVPLLSLSSPLPSSPPPPPPPPTPSSPSSLPPPSPPPTPIEVSSPTVSLPTTVSSPSNEKVALENNPPPLNNDNDDDHDDDGIVVDVNVDNGDNSGGGENDNDNNNDGNNNNENVESDNNNESEEDDDDDGFYLPPPPISSFVDES